MVALKTAQKYLKGNTELSSTSTSPKKHHAYVFTSFLDEPPIYDEVRMKYLLYAPETCPETNRSHWQCYVVWRTGHNRTMTANAKYFGKAHTEVAIGDVSDQLDYIRGPYDNDNGKTKPYNDKWCEFGERPRQGKRTDLEHMTDEILSGKLTVDNIATENPMMYHQYGRTFNKVEDIRMRSIHRTEMTQGIWYWGATGTGKSHKAYCNFSFDTHYNVPKDNGWWDNYCQQDTVIINDFRGEIAYNEMLQMVDRFPYEVKRRNRPPLPFTSKKVIITSSLHPRDIFNRRHEEDSLEQLLRRFKIIKMDTEYSSQTKLFK